MEEMEKLQIDLFERYLRKEASDSEKKIVETWLHAHGFDQEDLKLLISPSNELRFMLSVDAANDFVIVEKRLPAQKSKTRFMPVWRMAASLLLIAAAASVIYLWIGHNRLKTVANHASKFSEHALPDGSVVFMKTGGEITYSEDFSSNRELSMSGEVFFEVKPDAVHPFVIHTQHIHVQVVGTSFQVNERANEAEVIVATGKVSMKHPGVKPVFLEKGERGLYHQGDSQILTEQNGDLNYLSWKTGILEFKDTPIDKAVADLETYFDVTITIKNPAGSLPTYTSRLERPALQEVLEEMKLTLGIDYRIAGKKITLTINQ